MNQTTKSVAQLARGRALLFGLGVEEAIESQIDSIGDNLSPLEAEVLRESTGANLMGFGPIQNLLNDSEVEEVWINRPNEIWFADSRGHHRIEISLSSLELETYVSRMLRSTSRRLDRSHPFVDASLPDGSRLHVAIPNITREHWSVNIRKFRLGQISLSELQQLGSITSEQSDALRALIAARKSIVVSGATQAGKTTLLTALLNELPTEERLVTVEDTFEINCSVVDWVAMQTRPTDQDFRSGVDLRGLVRETLRMRPTRIAVGEVRGAESLDMLLAFNSGFPGFCTLHANSAQHALQKLKALPLLAAPNIAPNLIEQLVFDNVSAIVHCQKTNGLRGIAEILELKGV